MSIDLPAWTLPRQLEKDASMLMGLWSHSKWAVPSTGLAPSQYRAGDRGAEYCLEGYTDMQENMWAGLSDLRPWHARDSRNLAHAFSWISVHQ